ncbi:MAG: deoxynucleoside kinase [Ignavibacteria bacterium]|nr:deoxynucleoside kinase [Bacteroidota bacterium]MSQ45730.1 deoxynucleoside kinase [Ignavibacteria bacterium]
MINNKKYFVAIAGNIGSGKSSLTTLLSKELGFSPFYESVDDNPYLSDFYGDMKRWSFNLQIYFLSHRFQMHKKIVESSQSVIQDRTIYEDAQIFAKNIHSIGRMDDRDYKNYVSLFNAMIQFLKPPDLLIYLRANVDTLTNQIKTRGRSFEKSIEKSYLEQLNLLYEDWINNYKIGNLLVIESDGIDFVNSNSDLKIIKEKILAKLSTI